MKPLRAIVVGAGAGGLSAAAHLAGGGFHVTVFEKNERAGGRCGQLERDGHVFDTGPTLLVMPELYAQEFAALGVPLREALDLRRVDPTYHLYFDDGTTLALTSDLEKMREQLEGTEPGAFAAMLRYLGEGSRHYHLAMDHIVRRNFRTLAEFLSPANWPVFLGIGAFRNHYRGMKAYFREPRLKAAFTFQDMYMGLSPFEAPSTFSMMPYCELAEGVWFPRGGMARIGEALATIAEQRGVEIQYRAPVERIEVEGARASGVRLADGTRLKADVVLANADLTYVYRDLLPDPRLAERLERKRYSCSTISFLWGLDRVFEQLAAHTLFLCDDYRESFDAIVRRNSLAEDPSVYLHAPARLDPSMAPQGEDTLIGIVPVGHLDGSGRQDWDDLKRRARSALLRRMATLGIRDLDQHVKFEICLGPGDWQQRFNLVKGATHGLAHTITQMGYLRPHNRHARYRNLYFAGASTHPGTGLPTAIVSGRLAAERVLEDNASSTGVHRARKT
jgi:phytoene desaturase